MQDGLTVNEIHEQHPDINRKLIQTVAREELAPRGLARKIGSKQRGTWLISVNALPDLIPDLQTRSAGRKARQPTEIEKAETDRIYRLHGSVVSVARHFGIRWSRAKAWLIGIYGPNMKEWPAYQHPI